MKCKYYTNYDFKHHYHIKGIIEYRDKHIKYSKGELINYIVKRRVFPEYTHISEWSSIILEVFERRSRYTSSPCFRIPDNIWFAVHAYLDTMVDSTEGHFIDLTSNNNKKISHNFVQQSFHEEDQPVLFDGTDNEIFKRGIDALILNPNEIEGKLEYVTGFEPYVFTFHYQKGKLEQFVIRKRQLPESILDIFDIVMEMKERYNKNINGPFIKITSEIMIKYHNFLTECIKNASSPNIYIHDTSYHPCISQKKVCI